MSDDYYASLIREKGRGVAADYLADDCRKKDLEILYLKLAISELLAGAEEYTNGLSCIFCGKLLGNTEIEHGPKCWGKHAQKLIAETQ